MLAPKTPGVYIQEISTLPASIAAVETAIPAFIGYTEIAEKEGNPITPRNTPTRITSLLEFQEMFGGPNPEVFALTVDDQYDVENALASRTFSAALTSTPEYNLYYHLQMYFNNGGGPCYIVSVADFSAGTVDLLELQEGVTALEKVDEPTLLVFPDATSLNTSSDYGQLVQTALAQCNKLQDRFTICDAFDNGTSSSIGDFRNNIGIEYLKYGAAYHPYLKTTLNYGYLDSALAVTHNKSTDHPTDPAPVSPDFSGLFDALLTTDPSIYRSLEVELKKTFVELSPAGAIAGVYARVDSDRGVWKAPANVGLSSTLAPTIKITNELQDDLNVDATSGKSINAIRAFAGKGILVWGARTLAGNDNEWRYVPVRRFFIFVEESVKKATEFVVFEPNDANTWIRMKAMIENFLTGLWREGALAGAKPEDAFFVKVGLGETMTAIDILEGRMNVEIGMAAVRPAEFIILKFSHKLQES